MPYIKQEERIVLDQKINELAEAIKTIGVTSGRQNYVITRLLDALISKPSYETYNSIIGTLECAKLEFYRRKIAAYEDIKCRENGDAYKQE